MSENFKKPDALTEWMGDLDEVRPDDWDVQSRSLADALQNNINYFNNFPLDKYLKFFPDYNPTDAELNAINADGGQGSVRIDVKMGVEVEWSMQGTEQEYFSDVDRQKVKERISALETEKIHPDTSSERVRQIQTTIDDVKNFSSTDMFMWNLHEDSTLDGAMEKRFGTSKEFGWRDDGLNTVEVQTPLSDPITAIENANKIVQHFEKNLDAYDGASLDYYNGFSGRGMQHIHWSFLHNGKNIGIELDPQTGMKNPSQFYLASVAGVVDKAESYHHEFFHNNVRGLTSFKEVTAGTIRDHNMVRYEGANTDNFHAEYRNTRPSTLLKDSAALLGASRVGIDKAADGWEHSIMRTHLDSEGNLVSVNVDEPKIYNGREKNNYIFNQVHDPDARIIYGDDYVGSVAQKHGIDVPHATRSNVHDTDTSKPTTVSVRAGNYSQAGFSAAGIVMGSRNFINSYQQGDTLGMLVSSSDVVISAADAGLDLAIASGRTFATSMTSAMVKANIAIIIADLGYQVIKEEGKFIDVNKDGDFSIGNKGERLIAGTATAGTAILVAKGTGAALAAAGTTGMAVTVLPLTLAVGSTIAVATLADTIIDIRRNEEHIDQQIDAMTEAGKFMKMDRPSLFAYRQSFNTIRWFDDKIGGKLGELVNVDDLHDLKNIDFTDPELVAEFEAFLKAEIENQQRIFDETDGGWFRSSKKHLLNNNAEVNLAMLKAAQDELVDFKAEIAEFNQNHDNQNTTGPSLTEYHRTQEFTDVGGYNMQENGKFGSNVNIHGGEQPSLATDVFNVIPKLDATAMKGPLSSVTMAIAEKKQAATFESESVDYAKHYKSSFDIG